VGLDPAVDEVVVLGAEPLGDDVVHVEAHPSGIGAEGDDGLADREVLEVGHAGLDHEPPSAPEVGGGVLEAGDLGVLGDQVEDGVEDQVDEGELPVDPGAGEVADRHLEVLAPGLGPQPGHHRLGAVDAGDPHDALGQRQRDPPGADPELQRSAPPGKTGQQVHDRGHHRRVEHAGGVLVVHRRDALAEEPLVVAPVRWHQDTRVGPGAVAVGR